MLADQVQNRYTRFSTKTSEVRTVRRFSSPFASQDYIREQNPLSTLAPVSSLRFLTSKKQHWLLGVCRSSILPVEVWSQAWLQAVLCLHGLGLQLYSSLQQWHMNMVWLGHSGYANIRWTHSKRGSSVLVCCWCDCTDSHVLDIGLQSQAKRSEMPYIPGNHLHPLWRPNTLGFHLLRPSDKRPGQQSASSRRKCSRHVSDRHERLCCHLSDTTWYVFSESMFPLLNRSLGMGACLRGVYSVDLFKSSTHTLKSAILTPKS